MNDSTSPTSPDTSVDLSTELCGILFSNPVWLGSGGLGENAELLEEFQGGECGAVVTRTVRGVVRPHRKTFPNPHLALDVHRRWLLNCEWGNLQSLDYWLHDGLPQCTSRGPVVASVSGRESGDCVETVRALNGSGVSMYEINFSCSHAGALDGRINDDREHVGRVVSAVCDVADRPVIAKLGWSPNLRSVASSAEVAGCSAIAVTNSIGPGLDIDIRSGRPRLGIQGGYGGVSGPAIFPIALQCVNDVASTVSVPIIGIGGVTAASDAIKMLMAGATCVQVYTAALLRGPSVFSVIVEGLRQFLSARKLRSPAELVGFSRSYLEEASRLKRKTPRVDPTSCHPCGACVRVCPSGAITLQSVAVIDPNVCTSCGICVDVCPPRFNALAFPDYT